MQKRKPPAKGPHVLILAILLMLAAPPGSFGQPSDQPAYKPEELEQILAPIALYPDSLLAQVFMAATYPLEVVQADRWAKQNKDLKGDALTAALEKQAWDPSVKSLVNFPRVLSMLSEKLDWTQKLGDAFLAQQKDVMDTVQTLRKRAADAGNLKTTKEQQVIVTQETIVIEAASPQVVYVPAYNPTVVYGAWPYPAYPPAYYYPPGYAAGAALFSFGVGVAVGAAWGYAWGGCDWHGGDVDVDIDRNTNINRNINRENYKQQYQGGRGNWQHNPEHRKGVAYRDQATGQKYNRAATSDAVKSRENYRGRADAGRQDVARGDAGRPGGSPGSRQPGGIEGRPDTREAASRDRAAPTNNALNGMDRGGSETRDFSNRGSTSRQSVSSGSARESGFSGGGSARSGGGRGGGRR